MFNSSDNYISISSTAQGGLTLKGTGSLTIDADTTKGLAIGPYASGAAINISLKQIDVTKGSLLINSKPNQQSGTVTVEADSITVGGEGLDTTSTAKATAILNLSGATAAATLGREAEDDNVGSAITVADGGVIKLTSDNDTNGVIKGDSLKIDENGLLSTVSGSIASKSFEVNGGWFASGTKVTAPETTIKGNLLVSGAALTIEANDVKDAEGNEISKGSFTLASGSLAQLNHTINISGTTAFKVEDGVTLVSADSTNGNISLNGGVDVSANSSAASGDEANISISSTTLKNFLEGKQKYTGLTYSDANNTLTAKDEASDPSKTGGLLLQSGASLILSDTANVDLTKTFFFTSGDAASTGTIAIGTKGGFIKGHDLTVSDSLKKNKTDPFSGKLLIEADKLTLGSEKYAAAGANLGFTTAKAKSDLNFVGPDGKFVLLNEVVGERDYFTQQKDEDDNEFNTFTENASGKISGSDLTIGSSTLGAALKIKGGKWVTDDGMKITVVNGDFVVSSAPNTGFVNNGNPSYLALNGSLILNEANTKTAAVEVTGDAGADATMDLTNADVVWGSGSITVKGTTKDVTTPQNPVFTDGDAQDFYADNSTRGQVGWGKLLLNGADFNEFLGTSGDNTKFEIGQGGYVRVNSTVTGEHSFANFKSGTAAAGQVAFNGASGQESVLDINGDLNLYTGDKANPSTAATALDIGYGTIAANNIDLHNYYNTDKNKVVAPVTVKNGTLEVRSELSTNSSKLVIGDASSTGAKIKLSGKLEQNGTLTGGTVTTGTDGLISLDQSGSLIVDGGDWSTAADIEVNDANAELTISASAEERDIADALSTEENTVYAASFKADNLNVTTGTVTVDEMTKATFNTMQVAADQNVNVSGHLVINGLTGTDLPEKLADGKTDNPAYVNGTTAGIDLAGNFNISGAGATLELGAVATGALVKQNVSGSVWVSDKTADNKSTWSINKALDNATFTVKKFGEIKLNMDSGATINKYDAKFLTKQLIDDTGSDKSGYLNLGEATLDIKFDDKGNVTWDEVADFARVTGGQATTDKLKQALVYGIDSRNDMVQGHYGALQVDVDSATTSLKLNGPTTLHNAAKFGGYFVFSGTPGENQSAVSVTLRDQASLGLENGGIIGAISGNGTNDVAFYGTGKTEVQGSIDKIDELSIRNETLVQGDISADFMEVLADTTVAGKNNNGKISARELLVDATGTLTAHSLNLNLADADNKGGTANILGQVKLSDTLSLTKDHDLKVWGGAVSTKDVTLSSTSSVTVGYEPGSNAVDNPITEEVDESKSYTGTFEATGTTILSGGSLAVDPDYGMPTALASLNNLSTGANDKTLTAGTLDGVLYVGQNAALAVGSDNLAQLQDKIARFQTNGSLGGGEDEIGSILYVAKNFTVDATKAGITLTAQSQEDFRKYFNENKGSAIANLAVDAPVFVNTMYLGDNTAILVDAAVMSKAVVAGEGSKAVITFSGTDKGTVIADGGEVIIDGDLRATTYQVFANADIKYLDGNTYGVVTDSKAANYENNINVTTTNEFLQGVVAADGSVKLGIASNGRVIMGGASDPVYETLVAYVNGYNGTPSKGENGVETVAESQKLYNGYIDGPAGEDGKPTKVKNTDYSNSFLQAVISNGNGQDAETAARLGVFGGSVQAAISAGNTSADAIAGRFGMGAQAAGMTFADNGQGAGLWVAPVYRTADSDSFDAEGVEYGVDMNLYGVALGGDYTLSNGLRIGAMFNIGSGDADGQGVGSLATNDFDYYGFAAFAGYTMGQFSVVGDISYTTVDNEVTANTSVDKIGAKFDSTNLSVGVTGQYALNFNGVDVTPHAGMRLSMIDMDDYVVDGEDEIANYSADKMTVFSIPVGVTFAKEFEGESWTVKPSFDLTLTGQFGDDKAEGTVEWKGVSNLSTAVSSEVFDNFTYGAAAGVAAKTGNFSLGLGLNYTGSSNVSEFGVNANARFVF